MSGAFPRIVVVAALIAALLLPSVEASQCNPHTCKIPSGSLGRFPNSFPIDSDSTEVAPEDNHSIIQWQVNPCRALADLDGCPDGSMIRAFTASGKCIGFFPADTSNGTCEDSDAAWTRRFVSPNRKYSLEIVGRCVPMLPKLRLTQRLPITLGEDLTLHFESGGFCPRHLDAPYGANADSEKEAPIIIASLLITVLCLTGTLAYTATVSSFSGPSALSIPEPSAADPSCPEKKAFDIEKELEKLVDLPRYEKSETHKMPEAK